MFRTMKKYLLPAFLAVSFCASAQNNDTARGLDRARGIIADLNHIVAPTGVQESYMLRIGGIDQWVYVRGQDTANPRACRPRSPGRTCSTRTWASAR